MSERLPLFPLGTVLFPGLVLPLHIFEPRYRRLVRDLLSGPSPRQFGVIAIREGRETGVRGVSALHEVGCVAMVKEITELDDGRYDMLTVGTQRFRLGALDESLPYLTGDVELLDDPSGDEAETEVAVRKVQRAFRGYLDVLASAGSADISVPDLPDEPVLLSYLVAAAMIIELPDRQELLAQPDAVSRLAVERTLLSREVAILRSLSSTPAPDLRFSPYSSN